MVQELRGVIMWKVEVTEYSRAAQDSFTYKEYFNSKKEALDYCDSLKGTDCTVSLQDMTYIDGEYFDDEVCYVQAGLCDYF